MPILSRVGKIRLALRVRPRIRAGFDRAISTARRLARATAVYNAVSEGDPADVIRAMGISEARYLLDFIEGLRSAYIEAGQAYMERIPAKYTREFGAIFDHTTPSASLFLEQYSSKRVVQIAESQREAVRAVLALGNAQGRNPRDVALDLIGRKFGGTRDGGVFGLTRDQAIWVMNAREELESGDPAAMRRYLNRARRDRGMDDLVSAAIAKGQPPSQADINRLINAYASGLLNMRAETIARTESAEAVGNAALQSLRQAVENGDLEESDIIRRWRTAGPDGRRRDSHASMEGQERTGLSDPFKFPGGSFAKFPGDGGMGAPAKEIVNCRCWAEEDLA